MELFAPTNRDSEQGHHLVHHLKWDLWCRSWKCTRGFDHVRSVPQSVSAVPVPLWRDFVREEIEILMEFTVVDGNECNLIGFAVVVVVVGIFMYIK